MAVEQCDLSDDYSYGRFIDPNGDDQLAGFWKRYRLTHPDHDLYSDCERSPRHECASDGDRASGWLGFTNRDAVYGEADVCERWTKHDIDVGDHERDFDHHHSGHTAD